MASTSTSPKIGIELVTPGPEFFITPEPAMPAITVRALLPAGAGAESTFHWTVTIVFDASKHPSRPERQQREKLVHSGDERPRIHSRVSVDTRWRPPHRPEGDNRQRRRNS